MTERLSDVAFLTPETLEEALALRATRGARARVIAGGTDVMVGQYRRSVALPEAYLSIWALTELKNIRHTSTHLEIGALSTFTEILASADVARYFPALSKASRWVGAVQIQNRATLGGNIVNASPAGDTLPVLSVADAVLVLQSASRGIRLVPFNEFYTGYRQTVLEEDELLTRIELPLPAANTRSAFDKVGSRQAQTISKVMAAIQARFTPDGKMRNVALALGAVAPTVIRLPRTEAALQGEKPSSALADAIANTLRAEISPIDDLRSTAEYRRFVAVGLLRRFLRSWEEH